MKKAVIDQLLLWIVLFVSFATIFFLVIDYAEVIRVKDKCDALANYGARMKALGKSDSEIVEGLNKIKSKFFDDIEESDLSCTDVTVNTNPLIDEGKYQVVLTTNITFDNKFLDDDEKVYATFSTFNEVDSTDWDCSLDLRKAE